MADKIIMKPTAEEWLEQSPWWRDEQTYNRYAITDYGTWTFYYEDDGMGSGSGRIGTLEGRLIDCLRHVIEKYGDSFYGWGQQGKIYKTDPVRKIPAPVCTRHMMAQHNEGECGDTPGGPTL